MKNRTNNGRVILATFLMMLFRLHLGAAASVLLPALGHLPVGASAAQASVDDTDFDDDGIDNIDNDDDVR